VDFPPFRKSPPTRQPSTGFSRDQLHFLPGYLPFLKPCSLPPLPLVDATLDMAAESCYGHPLTYFRTFQFKQIESLTAIRESLFNCFQKAFKPTWQHCYIHPAPSPICDIHESVLSPEAALFPHINTAPLSRFPVTTELSNFFSALFHFYCFLSKSYVCYYFQTFQCCCTFFFPCRFAHRCTRECIMLFYFHNLNT
jgi:hypothetical protein